MNAHVWICFCTAAFMIGACTARESADCADLTVKSAADLRLAQECETVGWLRLRPTTEVVAVALPRLRRAKQIRVDGTSLQELSFPRLAEVGCLAVTGNARLRVLSAPALRRSGRLTITGNSSLSRASLGKLQEACVARFDGWDMNPQSDEENRWDPGVQIHGSGTLDLLDLSALTAGGLHTCAAAPVVILSEAAQAKLPRQLAEYLQQQQGRFRVQEQDRQKLQEIQNAARMQEAAALAAQEQQQRDQGEVAAKLQGECLERCADLHQGCMVVDLKPESECVALQRVCIERRCDGTSAVLRDGMRRALVPEE